jgi:hypothetical protein
MNDTSPEMQRTYRALLLQRSGAERVKMGGSMFATARALMLAGLRARNPAATPAALRRALFLRLYGADFGDAERERIAERLGRDD